MGDRNNSSLILSFIGEFKDKAMEDEYTNHYVKSSIKYIKPLLLLYGILFLLLFLSDYFLIKNTNTIIAIFLLRLSFFLSIIPLYNKIGKMDSPSSYYKWITTYEIIASVTYLTIFYIYETPDLLINSCWIMIIILSFHLIPSRGKFTFTVSFILSIAFFILAFIKLKPDSASHYYAALAYIQLTILLSSISSIRNSRLRRLYFLNNKELLRLSKFDSLTGIYNRLKFDEELEASIKLSKTNNSNLSIVMFDIDDFKKVNDNFGHLTGDRVLIDCMNLIKNCIRERDLLARWGGEEFVVLLSGTSIEAAVELAERLKLLISEHHFHPVGHISCSFGVASLDTLDDVDTLLNRVDQQLYSAKKQGKNTVASSQ